MIMCLGGQSFGGLGGLFADIQWCHCFKSYAIKCFSI